MISILTTFVGVIVLSLTGTTISLQSLACLYVFNAIIGIVVTWAYADGRRRK